MTRFVVTMIGCASIVVMAFFIRWESQGDPSNPDSVGSIKFRSEAFSCLLGLGLFVLVWAILNLLYEERTAVHPGARSHRAPPDRRRRSAHHGRHARQAVVRHTGGTRRRCVAGAVLRAHGLGGGLHHHDGVDLGICQVRKLDVRGRRQQRGLAPGRRARRPHQDAGVHARRPAGGLAGRHAARGPSAHDPGQHGQR